MNKLTLITAIIALGAVVSQAGIVNGDSILVDFNSASDASDFLTIRDDTPSTDTLGIAQSATKGTGTTASGGLEAVNVGGTNGSNDLAALYTPGGVAANGAITLNAGETLVLRMKYKVLDQSKAATPRLGVASLSDVSTATTGFTVLDINGGKDIIGGTTSGNHAGGIAVNTATGGNKTFNIANVIGGGGRTLLEDTEGPYDLINDAWYEYVLEITKSATSGEFDVAISLNALSADGTAFSSEVGAHSATITNQGLYDDGDMIAGMTIVHDGGPSTVSNEYDDLSIAVIPEPATLGMVALFGGGILFVRRKLMV